MTTDAIAKAPSSGLQAGECEAVGPPYADRRVAVYLAEGVGGGGQHQQDARPEQEEGHQRGQGDADDRLPRRPAETPATSGASRIRLCSPATTREAGTVRNPIPMNIRHRDAYMRAAARITCPVALRRAMRKGVTGVQVVRRTSQTTSRAISARITSRRDGIVRELADDVRPAGHGAAEEVGGGGAEQAAGRDGVAGVAALLFQVADRLGPAVLGVRAGRSVVERLLALPPSPLEAEPGELGQGGRRIAGDDGDGGTHVVGRAAGVVAAEPLLAGRAEVERVVVVVGVRSGGRMHDGMSAVDDLELRVVPLGDLEALRAGCSRPRSVSGRAPASASAAAKTSSIISQSPSCLLVKSLNG